MENNTKKEYYLDNASTTKVCVEAIDAEVKAMEEDYGNPSSTHTKGREALKLLSSSRKTIASALGAKESEIIFTSCGSESDNTAVICGAHSGEKYGRHIISSKAEHDAVRKSLALLENEGYEVTYLSPDETGRINPEDVRGALRDDTILVSLMMVNNETGAVTDIESVGKILKEKNSRALLHTDAVQGFLKIPFRAKTLGADLISISGHKIHAPKGIGALYIRDGVKLRPMIVGGSQEFSLRAGTENIPHIAAFAAAAKAGLADMENNICRMKELKEKILSSLQKDIPSLNYLKTDSPNILSISLPGYRSEVIMNFLEARNIYVSKSSACKKGARSHVLEAIGMKNENIDGAIRIGLSRFTTEEDAEMLCRSLAEAAAKLAHR